MNFKSLIMFIFLFIGSEFIVNVLSIPEYLLPPPSQILATLWYSRRDILPALLETTQNTLTGLFLSFLTGTILALIISLSSWIRAGILPIALFFQTVPIIAIAPMLVIWFGFGSPTIIASSCIVSFFPLLAATLQGLESSPKSAVELFQLYHASRFHLYLKLKVPYAVPWIFNGLKIALGLAVVGSIVGEFVGGGGLGSLIDSARTQQRTDLVFAAVVSSCGLGWILTLTLELIKNLFFKKWLQD